MEPDFDKRTIWRPLVIAVLSVVCVIAVSYMQQRRLAEEKQVPVCDATDCSGYFFDRLYANHELEPYGFDFKKRLEPGMASAAELLALMSRAGIVQGREAPAGSLVFFSVPYDPDNDKNASHRVGLYLGSGRVLMPVGSRFSAMSMSDNCGASRSQTLDDCRVAYSDISQLPRRDAPSIDKLLKTAAVKDIKVGHRVEGGIYIPPAVMIEALKSGDSEGALMKKLGDLLAAQTTAKQ